MPFENILLEREGQIATLTLNRPQALNALDQAMLDELSRTVEEIARDDAVRVLIITGAGERAFAAGADLNDLNAIDSASAGGNFSQRTHRVFQKLVDLPKPVIAAINGYALGGGLELALACDIRIAADTTEVGLPEVSLGIIPGWGGTTRLVRLVGPGMAKLMILSAMRIKAEEAQQLGIIERVVSPAALMDEARALANQLVGMPPLALAAAKQAINRSHDLALADANAFESALFGQVAATEDAREGSRAFLEKRSPVWKGR
jgi:enoyl-CoA hydratase